MVYNVIKRQTLLKRRLNMKIGRNSPCPCGSGKKYKKCCLLKASKGYNATVEKTFSENERSDFAHVTVIADKLYERLKKYRYSDLVKAIYCFNLWRKNRSALSQAFALNYVLTTGKSFGDMGINDYSDLSKLFDEISDILEISVADYIIDDYGEIFINHCGKTYSIITGTGHQQVYGAIRFMQTLADIRKKENELTILLEYIQLIIDTTKETNESNSDMLITFELPSRDFWESVLSLFNNDEYKTKCIEASKIMGYQTGPIEKRHFVKNNDTYLPLCNLSILVDYYKLLLLNSTDAEKDLHIKNTLLSVIDSSYNFSNDTPNRVLLRPWVFKDTFEHPLLKSGIVFSTIAKNKLIIALDDEIYKSNSDIQKLKNQIKDIKEKNQLKIMEPFQRDGAQGAYGIQVDKNSDIIYILLESFTDITSDGMWLEDCDEECFNCTALDLLYIIGFADGFEEIVDYISYDSNEESQIVSFGGKFNHFATWKNSHHLISSGAIEYNVVNVDYNQTEDYVLSYFSKSLHQYPRNDSSLFNDPLNWKTKELYPGYLHLTHKGCLGFVGEATRIGSNINLFLAHNMELYSQTDMVQNFETLLLVIDELNHKLFLRYSNYLQNMKFLKGKTLQLLFIPWTYANTHYKEQLLSDSTRSIVYSDEFIEDSIIIRYSVEPHKLMEDLQNIADRTIENTYFRELILPLSKYAPDEFENLQNQLNIDNSLKKTVSAFTIEREYYYSDKAIDTDISEISFTKARKEIAQICKQSGIIPGEYKKKHATKMIRAMQCSLVKRFEEIISQYDKFDLHKKTLNYLAIQQNGAYVNFKRYSAFQDMDEQVLEDFEYNTREIREKYRRNEDTAIYLLESNLWVKHKEDAIICSEEDFNFLLAYSDWLVVLQEDSDLCHHEDDTYNIVVDNEYKVDTVMNIDANVNMGEILSRKYNSTDYHINDTEVDTEFIKKVAQAFKEDTDIDLGIFLALMEYMELAVVAEGIATEIYPNVFEVKSDVLKSTFVAAIEDGSSIENDVVKAIEFLKLQPEKLKVLGDEMHNILPAWERENRDNRIEIKPIIEHNGSLIFSPVNMNYVKTRWENGITDWYLPFEIGLLKVKEELVLWKKYYEDKMVCDIAQMFRDKGFDIVEHELDFFKRYPKERYPQDLGDYDVFAFNKQNQELWYIESKVLQKVGSVYEMQMQQKSFFRQHKEDEKFQRRIDYLYRNTSKMLKSIGIECENIKIIPYMVTNKIFYSRYKNVKFSIISFSELADMLKKEEA